MSTFYARSAMKVHELFPWCLLWLCGDALCTLKILSTIVRWSRTIPMYSQLDRFLQCWTQLDKLLQGWRTRDRQIATRERRIDRLQLRATMIDRLQLMVANTTISQLDRLQRWKAHKIDRLQLFEQPELDRLQTLEGFQDRQTATLEATPELDRLQTLEGFQDRQIATLEATPKITIHFKVNFVRRIRTPIPRVRLKMRKPI